MGYQFSTTFAALQNRQFRLLWFGQVLSNTGLWMQSFGLGWLVVQLAMIDGTPERAPLYIGLVGLAKAVPSLGLTLLAGAIVDRSDRRRVLLMTQSASAVLSGVLAILAAAGLVTIGGVLVLTFLLAISQAFDSPARQSMLPRLVPREQIMSAIGVQSLAVNGTAVLGPGIGGVLIVPFGVAGLFATNALSYLAVIAALLLMRPMPVEHPPARESIFRGVREGLAHIAADPILRTVFGLAICSALFARPYLNLLPAFVANVLGKGAPELSLLMAATGAGTIVGGITVASIGGLPRRGMVYLSAAGALGLLLIVLALQTQLLPCVVAAFALGAAVMAFMGLSNSILQTTSPPGLLGRVVSVHVMTFMGVMPLGQLLLGSLGSVFGLVPVLSAGGAILALAALVAMRRARSLRGIGATREILAPADVGGAT